MYNFSDAEQTVERAIGMAKEINNLTMLKRAYSVALDVYSRQDKKNRLRLTRISFLQ
jgi:hypothetical protein